MCNILDDQRVIVYGTIGLLYDGEWKDAPDDIKFCRFMLWRLCVNIVKSIDAHK